MYDACISRMQYFEMDENMSSYLHVHHTCFGHMTFMCKTHELVKEQFSHGFHYQLMGWEVCDHYKEFVNRQLDE
jgi:hypothetical protein